MGIFRHSQNSKLTMSLQYLKKELRNEVDFFHLDKHQSFLKVDFNTSGIKDVYKVILSLLLCTIKHSQSTQSSEHQSFYKLGLLFLIEAARFYGVPAMFIVTCFLVQPDCINVLPEHCSTIIKQQLCGERLPFPLLQVGVFQEKQGILQQIILDPSNKPEKVCIRS